VSQLRKVPRRRRRIIRDFFCDRQTGSSTYGRRTANKMWVSPKFFLFPGIFRLKIEKHSQKISQKNYAECVLDFVIGSIRRF
jgi:hypothetical protein